MKHTFIGFLIAMTLTLALLIGAVAMAENAEPEMPAIEQTQPEQAPAQSDTSTALQDAFKAYNDAKSSSRQDDIEAELKSYVEAGKLTQEQADLILNYYKEQQALRNGTCPSCGYQFQNGYGKGGRGMGGKGGRGMMGMNGMMGQQLSAQNSGNADGTAFTFEAQTLPELENTDDVI